MINNVGSQEAAVLCPSISIVASASAIPSTSQNTSAASSSFSIPNENKPQFQYAPIFTGLNRDVQPEISKTREKEFAFKHFTKPQCESYE